MAKASASASINSLGEFALIEEITKSFKHASHDVIHGIGDDAAVIRTAPNSAVLISTDLLAENIHFNLKYESFKDIGFRAAAANLSDIAAMGGRPQFVLVALAIPPQLSLANVRDVYRGLKMLCHRYHVTLIGGDTSSSDAGLFLSLTILGTITPTRAITRQGAEVGDHVYVTGTLGDSSAGFQLLRRQRHRRTNNADQPYASFLKKRHLRPIPRVELGHLLSTHRLAHAAIDISDGLSGDMHHICQASRVGVELWESRIPISRQCRAYASDYHLNPFELALAGGEDYEVLFTANAKHQRKLMQLSQKSRTPITCIGVIKPRNFGYQLKPRHGDNRKITIHSYEHFKSSKSRN